MTYQDTVRAAVLSASKHALPGLPDGAVQWHDAPQKQLDARFPNITISTVSHVPDGQVRLHRSTHTPTGELLRDFSQLWYWTIQVKVESWRADSKTVNNPWSVVNRMRFGWNTLSTERTLADQFFPVKMVADAGPVRQISAPVQGHMLPQYIYEIELSYVQYDADPEREGFIEHVELHGHIGGTTDDDSVVLTDEPSA